jgi:integrase
MSSVGPGSWPCRRRPPGPPARPAARVATAALVGGVHPKVVQERLGHSSIAITMNLNSHVLPGMGRQAASQVAGAILGADVINW